MVSNTDIEKLIEELNLSEELEPKGLAGRAAQALKTIFLAWSDCEEENEKLRGENMRLRTMVKEEPSG